MEGGALDRRSGLQTTCTGPTDSNTGFQLHPCNHVTGFALTQKSAFLRKFWELDAKMTKCMRSGDASFINQWKFKLRISPIPPVNMDQLWTTSEVLLRPNRQKSLHYLAIVTSYPIKSSHNILLNLREFVKWSRKRNSMRKIDTNNNIFLAAMLRSGGIPRTGSAYTGFTHSMARDRNFSI